MKVMRFLTTSLAACTFAALAMADPGHSTPPGEDDVTPEGALQRLLNQHPGLRAWHGPDGRVQRLWGQQLSGGATPIESARSWAERCGGVWNVDAADLRDGGVLPSGDVVVPLVVNADGSDRFNAVYFSQYASGVRVFEGRLTVLTLNQPGHPVVLSAADLRDLGDFQVTRPAAHLMSDGRMQNLVNTLVGTDGRIVGTPRVVVFAGYDNDGAEPVMGIEFIGEAGSPAVPEGHVRYRYVVEAETGDVLFEENQILNCGIGQTAARLAPAMVSDVTGQVVAYTTGDSAAAACSNEVLQGLPWANVSGPGGTVATDANGNFTHPHDGGSSSFGGVIDGLYFDINNEAGSEHSANANGASGDDITITYNASPSEQVTAQVNTYLEANRIRDIVLAYSPSFPTIATQLNFPCNVNLSSTCNAYYDYSSINFYSTGGGCNNTAFSVVVHHEYGHHGVSCAGSGQGEYGEGMGDIWGVLTTGDPQLARGFYADDCNDGIRNADNTCQYNSSSCSSCGSGIHACGQLISGVSWDFIENMGGFSNQAGLDEVRSVIFNSMMLHSGTSINAAICIDFLAMNDTDGNIDNGTPHWSQITSAFDDHGIDTPELALLGLSVPGGLPDQLAVGADVTPITLRVENLSGTLQSGSARLHHNVGGDWTAILMNPAGGDDYVADIPGAACGNSSAYFFSAQTTDGVTVQLPSSGIGEPFTAQHADGPPIVTWEEDFESNDGWSSSGSAADGLWDFGVPVNCNRGDPPADFDGNNRCALTDNSSANGCNSDVDDGTAVLESPDMDASAPGSVVRYARWFSNDFGAAPYTDTFVVQASFNGGATWTTVETVGPDGPEVSGGWYEKSWLLSDLSGYQATTEFRLRFTTSDGADSGSVVEAGVDAIAILHPDCDDTPACPGDLSGDGQTGADDILLVLAGWGTDGGDVDGDGMTDVNDLLLIIGDFGCEG
ncbi:MAG: hypothetical protein MK101_06815 [Phycisphaerales bacterium]|nr:hypothetical protein [Phycisphaerales bacterium]